jgi:hypothetical protein
MEAPMRDALERAFLSEATLACNYLPPELGSLVSLTLSKMASRGERMVKLSV